MNFLAHTYLSCSDEDLLVGNFLGDFLNNKQIALLPPSFQKGVLLHRHIDSYTDNHIEVRKATKLIRGRQGKYSPVVVDVFFDYILSQNWKRYEGTDIDEFCENIYGILMRNLEVIPVPKVKQSVTNMVNGDFLNQYQSIKGLQWTFEKIEQRTSFDNSLTRATEDLELYYEELEICFNSFFPDIIASTEQFCNC